jgi:hypothetical protein
MGWEECGIRHEKSLREPRDRGQGGLGSVRRIADGDAAGHSSPRVKEASGVAGHRQRRRGELADNARRWASAVSAIVMLNLNANEGTIE